MEVPDALLGQGGLTGRLRALLGVIEEARDRWRRRKRRRRLVAGVTFCLVSLGACLVAAYGPLSGGQGPAIRACGASSGCGSGRLGVAASLAAGRWEPMSPGPLSARSTQTAVWTGHELLLWGGSHQRVAGANSPPLPGHALGDGASYDPSTGTWRTLPPGPLAPRAGAAGVWTGTEAIFWGGDAPGTSTVLFSDGAGYDPSTDRWNRLPPSPLSPRRGASAFWTGTEMLVFGGYQATNGTVDDGAIYRPSTKSWALLPLLPSPPGVALDGATATWTGRQLLVWLTFETSSNPSPGTFATQTLQRTYRWAPGWSRWQRLPAAPRGLYGADVVWTGHEALFVGGSGCPPSAECAEAVRAVPLMRYDPTTARWGSAPGDPVATTPGAPVAWTGKTLIALNEDASRTGPSGTVLAPGDGAVFDPVHEQWRALPPSHVAGLDKPTVVWTGKDLLVWGSATGGVTSHAAELVPQP